MNDASIERVADLLVGVMTSYGVSVLGALALLIAGWLVAGWGQRATGRALRRFPAVDDTLRPFLASLVKYVILAVTLVAVLDRFGVETTSLLAVLGAAGLAVGLAMQGTLSNLAAGVMLLLFRPFRVGHFIDGAGISGTVQSISLFVTVLHTPDNVKIIVPNKDLWNTSIRNFSANPTRRLDLVFGVSYDSDIDKAFEIIREAISADARCHAEPAPVLVVGELADSSVNLFVRVWCNAGDYWTLRWDMIKAVKQRFDASGIEIPFPQRTVHVVGSAEPANLVKG